LFLFAHLPAAGAGDVDDEDLGVDPPGEVGQRLGDALGRPGAADCYEDAAHRCLVVRVRVTR
jgi:hypothetical protein